MVTKVANNAWATLSTGISAVDTTVTLTAGHGARFPTLGAGEHFWATLSRATNVLEVVKVTARTTDTLTVVRGQDGTTGVTFSTLDRLELRPCAALFNDLAQKESPTLTGTVSIPTPFNLGGVSVLPTAAELNHVDGVTAPIQTQINTLTSDKAPKATPTFTGVVTEDNWVLDASGRRLNTGRTMPAFRTSMPDGLKDSPGNGEIMSKTLLTPALNVGSGYNATTGKFTAPVTGLYFFYCNLSAIQSTSANTDARFNFLTAGGVVQSSASFGYMRTSQTGADSFRMAGFALFQLTAGDTVWVQCVSTTAPSYVSLTGHGSEFGGALLS